MPRQMHSNRQLRATLPDTHKPTHTRGEQAQETTKPRTHLVARGVQKGDLALLPHIVDIAGVGADGLSDAARLPRRHLGLADEVQQGGLQQGRGERGGGRGAGEGGEVSGVVAKDRQETDRTGRRQMIQSPALRLLPHHTPRASSCSPSPSPSPSRHAQPQPPDPAVERCPALPAAAAHLSVVHVSHDGDHGGARLQVIQVLLINVLHCSSRAGEGSRKKERKHERSAC